MTTPTNDAHPPEGAQIFDFADFKAESATPVFTVVRAPTCWCKLVFNEAKRTITCKLCGRVFDHFEALLYIVKEWPRIGMNLVALRSEKGRLTRERDELRSEIKNLKAQRRRAMEKADER